MPWKDRGGVLPGQRAEPARALGLAMTSSASRRFTGSPAGLVARARAGELAVCLTMGQWSQIDMLAEMLDGVRGARVTVATWSMDRASCARMRDWLADGTISDLAILVDRSWLTRKVEYARVAVTMLGAARVVPVRTHAKWVTVREPGALPLVSTGSGNLNPNRRIEHVEVMGSEEVCAMFEELVDEARALLPNGADSMSVEMSRAAERLDPGLREAREADPFSFDLDPFSFDLGDFK